uniref:Peptidase A1 domain-containing protein n=1 Tax=Acrobeloides nanus TaxID=290746 RepID=A0A914E8M1_9BILA
MCDINYNHSCFNQSLSSTYQDGGYNRGIPFGIDLFNVSGLTYKTQKFALGIYNSVDDSPGYYDGVLGLGWPSLATANVTPPLQNLLPLLDKPLFSVWFDRSISVGSFSNKKPAQAISETADPWIFGPKADVDAIISVMNAHFDDINSIYVIPCNRTGLPDWAFTIGGYQYNIPSNEYVIDLDLGNGNCAVTINGYDSGGFGPSWLLGDTFIRTYCNFYDIGNQQIGFSKAHHTSV